MDMLIILSILYTKLNDVFSVVTGVQVMDPAILKSVYDITIRFCIRGPCCRGPSSFSSLALLVSSNPLLDMASLPAVSFLLHLLLSDASFLTVHLLS